MDKKSMGFHPDDSGYGAALFSILIRLVKWLENPDEEPRSPEQFYDVLHEMQRRMPYMPPRQTNQQTSFLQTVDEFKYRRPVWDLIGAAVDEENTDGEPLEGSSEKALWLIQHVQTCRKLRTLEAAQSKFFHEISELNFTPADVRMVGEFQPKGEQAVRLVTAIADSLIGKLTEEMKKGKRA